MVLSDAIEDYRLFARHEAGHTANTCYSYTSWHRNFARWLEGQGIVDPPLKQLNAGLVRRYSYSLSSGQRRPRTVRSAIQALRALFTYLVNAGAMSENPAQEVRLPKKDAAKRLLINDADLEALLAATDRQHSDFRCVRDRAVLSVLIFCGLRRSELLNLTVQEVNLPERALLVQQGKGQKSRTVYLCPEVETAIREWLAMRQLKDYPHSFLFCTETKQRLGEDSLARMLEEVKAIAGLKADPRIKPHSIRHAAATRLLRNGADIRSIQSWLGHSQLQTTAVYLHTDEEQIRKIAPLASFRPGQASDAPPAISEPKEASSQRVRFLARQRQGR